MIRRRIASHAAAMRDNAPTPDCPGATSRGGGHVNTTRKGKGKGSAARVQKAQRAAASEALPIAAIARQLRGWADTVLGIAVPAADLAIGLATATARTRGQKSAVARAGAVLRKMRETAGLTLE